MNQSLSVKKPRIEVVDALRGFAVLAIVLVHNVEHFIFSVYPEDAPSWLAVIDKGVFSGVFALFGGKAYAIFSLLFGFTFYIQSRNQQQKGKDFGYRFLWRLVLLIGFAALDAAFFPGGDVLLLFVVVGIVLFLTRHWSDRSILLTAIFFLLQPMEWYHYFASLVDPSHVLPNLKVGELYAAVSEASRNGSFFEFIWTNITVGQQASLFWAIGAGRFFQTAGLFLLGTYLGRKQLFLDTEKNLRFWTKTLAVAAIAFTPLYVWKELIMQSDAVIIQKTVGTAFDMWQKLAFTLVLVSSFILLYYNKVLTKVVEPLRAYGKMSLTNYISQSVIGTLVYFPFGLYLAPHCGYTVSLLIGVGVFLLQVRFCKWWLSAHKQGPLEHIWHRWTWLGSNK